ncbi:MAG: hypothetical protein LAN70_01430 [Acidobacteriia bacterium]|nr:hypothetical protein [Terriglobia bacterium]
MALHLSGRLLRHALGFRFRDLQYLEQFLHQRFFVGHVGGVGGLPHLFAQALEIGGGDLQGVEEQRGFLVGEEVVGESAHDAVEGELKAGGVLDDGEDEFAADGGDGLVEAAEVASTESGLAAGLAGEQRVAAARRLVLGVELGGVYFLIRVHGTRYSVHNGINELGPRSRGKAAGSRRQASGGFSVVGWRLSVVGDRSVGQETVGSFERGGSEETNRASVGKFLLRRPLARTG